MYRLVSTYCGYQCPAPYLLLCTGSSLLTPVEPRPFLYYLQVCCPRKRVSRGKGVNSRWGKPPLRRLDWKIPTYRVDNDLPTVDHLAVRHIAAGMRRSA